MLELFGNKFLSQVIYFCSLFSRNFQGLARGPLYVLFASSWKLSGRSTKEAHYYGLGIMVLKPGDQHLQIIFRKLLGPQLAALFVLCLFLAIGSTHAGPSRRHTAPFMVKREVSPPNKTAPFKREASPPNKTAPFKREAALSRRHTNPFFVKREASPPNKTAPFKREASPPNKTAPFKREAALSRRHTNPFFVKRSAGNSGI